MERQHFTPVLYRARIRPLLASYSFTTNLVIQLTAVGIHERCLCSSMPSVSFRVAPMCALQAIRSSTLLRCVQCSPYAVRFVDHAWTWVLPHPCFDLRLPVETCVSHGPCVRFLGSHVSQFALLCEGSPVIPPPRLRSGCALRLGIELTLRVGISTFTTLCVSFATALLSFACDLTPCSAFRLSCKCGWCTLPLCNGSPVTPLRI